jgi:hypothetical protein
MRRAALLSQLDENRCDPTRQDRDASRETKIWRNAIALAFDFKQLAAHRSSTDGDQGHGESDDRES